MKFKPGQLIRPNIPKMDAEFGKGGRGVLVGHNWKKSDLFKVVKPRTHYYVVEEPDGEQRDLPRDLVESSFDLVE